MAVGDENRQGSCELLDRRRRHDDHVVARGSEMVGKRDGYVGVEVERSNPYESAWVGGQTRVDEGSVLVVVAESGAHRVDRQSVVTRSPLDVAVYGSPIVHDSPHRRSGE